MGSIGYLAGGRSYGARLTAARVGFARQRAPHAAVSFTAATLRHSSSSSSSPPSSPSAPSSSTSASFSSPPFLLPKSAKSHLKQFEEWEKTWDKTWDEHRPSEHRPPDKIDAPRDVRSEILGVAETKNGTAEAEDNVLDFRPSMMVYVLGSNLPATYLAHALSCIPRSPRVRMLFLNQHFAMNWRRKGSQVRVVRPFGNERPVRLYGEVVRPPPAPMRRLVVGAGRGFQRGRTPHRQPIIQNLVITEPCVPSIAAIEKIKHRLNSRSTICLLQPGLGVVERLNELYFPHPETRPRYILAHMTHKLGYTSRAFTTAELEQGKMMLTVYPPPELPQAYVSSASPEKRLQTTPAANERVLSMYRELSSPPAADEIAMPKGKQWKVKAAMANNGLYLMYLLGVAPTLGTGFYRWGSFMKEKVPDMIYTSASETVTTVLDLPLGDDISLNGYAYGLLQELVTEMIDVVRAMPETHADPSFLKYVESGQLKRDIMKQLHQFDGSSRGPSSLRRIGEYEGGLRTTTSTIDSLRNRGLGPIVSRGPSTMSVRTSLGRRSDVQFLTGYFVRRGRELGVACPKNEMMIRMVQARRLANKNRRKRDDHIGISDEAVASSDVRQATRYFSEQGALRKNAEDEGREPPMAYASAAGKFGRIDTAQSKRAVEEHDEIREVEKDEQVKEDEEIEEDEEDEEDTEDTEAAEDAADIQDPNFDGKPQPTG